MPTYEAWHDPDAQGYSCGTTAQIEGYRREGTLGPRSVLLYSFDAGTHEEAQAIHSLRMGWGPYRPEGEPEPCPSCGALCYPQGSGECWRCRSIESSGSEAMRPGQVAPNEFELAILRVIADAHPVIGSSLATLHVISREFTGVGSFTTFRDDGPPGVDEQLGLSALIHMPGIPHGMGAVLFCNGGKPTCLETFVYGDQLWDGVFRGFSIEPRDGAA